MLNYLALISGIVCKGKCQKAGRQKNGLQKLFCPHCRKHRQESYRYKACMEGTRSMVTKLVVEGTGIRGIVRILEIGVSTVIRTIIKAASRLKASRNCRGGLAFEVDEMWTYIGRKDNDYWVAYALNRKTREVIDFEVGKRTKATLKQLVGRLLVLKPRVIRTDKLTIYQWLIPVELYQA
ncbi:MAG: IS1 family transposase [Bacteroidetes bacterium]|nr:IS1 family transposase [Bacteroidota bacterium]